MSRKGKMMTSLKALANASHKLAAGPGGIHCPCCSLFGPPSKSKVAHRRIFRRVSKLTLKKLDE